MEFTIKCLYNDSAIFTLFNSSFKIKISIENIEKWKNDNVSGLIFITGQIYIEYIDSNAAEMQQLSIQLGRINTKTIRLIDRMNLFKIVLNTTKGFKVSSFCFIIFEVYLKIKGEIEFASVRCLRPRIRLRFLQ